MERTSKHVWWYSRFLPVAPLAIIGMVAGGQVGCAGKSGQPEQQVVVISTGTATEPTPTLSDGIRETLQGIAESESGGKADIFESESPTRTVVHLTPLRRNGQTENIDARREKLIKENLDKATDAVNDLKASTAGMDLLEGISLAVRAYNDSADTPRTLVVISSGLSTRGAVDLRQVTWQKEVKELVKELKSRDLLPQLSGWHVVFSGLGETAGAQPTLPQPIRDTLERYWLSICTASGAQPCSVDNSPRDKQPPAATVPEPIIPVDPIKSIQGPHGERKLVVSDSLLGFAGNSAVLPPSSQSTIESVADKIADQFGKDQRKSVIKLTGFTADPPGSTAAGCKRLSQQRADAVSKALDKALNERGIRVRIEAVGLGISPGTSSIDDGKFDEKQAAKMRRVEILY
ncbi:OmpA family protein [Streptomyces sp. NPDC002623]